MRKVLALLLVLTLSILPLAAQVRICLAAPSGPSEPTFIQDVTWGTNDQQGGYASVTEWNFKLPNPTLGGSTTQGDSSNNTLLMSISWVNSATISSLTDDGPGGSATWTTPASAACSSGTGTTKRNMQIRYIKGVKQGTQKFTLTFSAAAYDVHVRFTEYSGIDVVSDADAATCNANVNSASVAAGSITATDGDLVFQYAYNPDMTQAISAYSPNLSNLEPSSRTNSGNQAANYTAQWGIKSGTGSVNPTITATGSTGPWVTAAIALKKATAGQYLPATRRILREAHFRNAADTTGGTYAMNWPCSGNLTVILTGEAPVYHTYNATTPISDTRSNTWIKINPTNDMPYVFYSTTNCGATQADRNGEIVTMTNGGTPTYGWSPATVVFYDVQNAHATDPYDTQATNTATGQGNGTTATCGTGGSGTYKETDHMPDITPTTSSGIAFVVTNEGTGPVCDLVGTTFDSAWGAGITDDSSSLDNGNGHGHKYFSDTSTIDFHWKWATAASSTEINALAVTFK